MSLPDYGVLSRWLLLYGENAALAMAVVAVCVVLRPLVEGKGRYLPGLVLGALFGLGAIVSLSFPIPFIPGVLIDARYVFVLAGGLAGGPVGAATAGALTILVRLALGGPGTIPGVGGALIVALIGFLVARRYGAKLREFGILPLLALGFFTGLAVFLWGWASFSVIGLPLLPDEALAALLLLYPAITVLLGMALNTVRYDLWQQTRLRADQELHKRDEELRVSREHFARAQQVGGVGSVEVDIATDKAIWSDELYRLLGLPRTDSSFAYFLSAIHPEDRPAMIADRETLLRGEAMPGRDYRIVRPDGELRWLRRQSEVIRDEAGKPIRHVSSYVDVTELRRAEEQLRDSQEHLAMAQRVAQVGSGEANFLTGKVFATPALYEVLGLDPARDSISYEALADHIPPEERASILEIYKRSRAGEDTEPCEFRFIRPDGATIWVRRVASIHRDASGKPLRVVSTIQDITDRRRTEAELRAREEELRHSRDHLDRAQKVAAVASTEVDLLTQQAYWSDYAYTLFGRDRATTIPGKESFLEAVHPDDRERIREIVTAARRGEDTPPSEFRILHPDGTVRWLRRVAEIVRGSDGRPMRVMATALDITERKRAEDALLEREAQLRQTTERLALAQRIANLGSIEFDYATGAIRWTDEVYRLLGLDPANTTPSVAQMRGLVHPDDLVTFDEAGRQVRQGLDVDPGELRVIRPDGQVRWIYRSIRVFHDEAGNPVKSVATMLDVTERKRVEAALLEREMQLRQAGEHLALAQEVAGLGSIELDLRTETEQWSAEAYRILGLAPGTAGTAAMRFRAVVHPDDAPLFDRVGKLARAGKDVESGELRIVRPDGEIRHIYQVVRVLRDDSGNPTKVVTTVQDITARKVAQLERQELERQLTQAQKMEAVGNLTGGVAHDFNNLLSVILGRLEMAQEELSDRPQVRDWIRTCIGAAKRGAVLTRSMLAFSRQQPLDPVEVDLTEALRDVIALLPRTLGETIDIVMKSAPDLWHCVADPSQLQNALLNLALNARDAMPQGGKLTIAAENARLDEFYAAQNADVLAGDYVALSVSDTGTGMSAHVKARAFEPFFTTKEVGRGSGLGLSMVYGFVRQSGGHVKIYSEVGQGTTVTLYLPRSLAAAERVLASMPVPPPINGSGTIVVVEDDDDMRALATTQLQRLGYTVHSASTGPDALEMIDRNPEARLLLTDLTLPGGLSGRDLARRAQGRLPHLRILYMSGYSEDAARHHGRIDADVRLLQKPFGIQELREALHAVLH